MNVLWAACRDLLLAYHHVPQVFDERAIRAVLADMQPEKARILWGSQNFQVGCSGAETNLLLQSVGNHRLFRRPTTGVQTMLQLHLPDNPPGAILHKKLSCNLGAVQAIRWCRSKPTRQGLLAHGVHA